jgi:WD40 repeat protein
MRYTFPLLFLEAFGFATLVGIFVPNLACDGPTQSYRHVQVKGSMGYRPVAVIPCTNPKGWMEWGHTANGLYMTASPNQAVGLFEWIDTTLVRTGYAVPGEAIEVLPINRRTFLCVPVSEYKECDLELRSFEDGQVVQQWPRPRHYGFSLLRQNYPGNYVAVVAEETLINPPADWDWRLDRAKLGIIDMESDDLNWVCTLTGHSILVRDVAVSSDARYLALAAYEHGIAVVDVRAKRVAWTDYPPNIVDLSFVEFAPDGRRLYAGGHDAVIFEYESASGKVSNRWCITRSGSYEPGHRIKSLAVSPDGRWIAGGLSLDGDAVLVERESGRMLRLQHGVGTVRAISFSPDSRRVATWIPGSITVWAVPDVETP